MSDDRLKNSNEALWSAARKRLQENRDEVGERLQEAHESGELSHLYGKPLQLDDDPDWLVTKTLKAAGFSHPVLEQRKELEGALGEAEAVLRPVRRRRAWLERPEARCTAEQAQSFNEMRARAIEAYRDELTRLNRRILAFNLGVPASLHRRGINIEEAVREAERQTPVLDVSHRTAEPSPRASRGWRPWRRDSSD